MREKRLGLTMLAGASMVLVVGAGSAHAFFGELDPTFDGDGKAITDGPASNRTEGSAMKLQADGKIVVVGYTDMDPALTIDFDFMVARYNPNGSLDTGGFGGGDGIVTTDIGGADFASDVVIQSDGDIVVAGEADMGATGPDIAVVRYNGDGSLDDGGDGGGPLGWGADGIVTTDVATGAGYDYADGVAIEPGTGQIIVSGATETTATNWDFVVARYKVPDGVLDVGGFGGGVKVTDFSGDTMVSGSGDFGSEVALQSDGKIVVVGQRFVSSSERDFALARYETDGDLDPTFDGDATMPGFPGNGMVRTDFAGDASGRSVAIQADDKIVAVGSSTGFTLARYNAADGSLDTGFDGDGRVTTSFPGGFATDVVVQMDGKAVVAGTAPGTGGNGDFALARYNGSNGSLDPSLGGGGTVTAAIAPSINVDQARGVGVQGDGKIVAAGFAQQVIPDADTDDFAVARFGPDVSIPETSITSGPTGPTSPNPTFAFSSTEPGSFECRFDSDPFAPCNGGAAHTATSDLAGGPHSFEVRATDLFAHTDMTPARSDFTVGSCGKKTITVARSRATISGTQGNDVIKGTSKADVIDGEGGKDTIRGLGGNDLICGGAGKDRLLGGAGKDRLLGEQGKDTLKGGGGNDILKGGGGKDTLKGGGAKDRLVGGGGKDVEQQ